MRVTSVQLNIQDRPKSDNVEAVLQLLGQAPQSDLIMLPELWPCGFFSFDQYRSDSESIDGPTISSLRAKASELKTYLLIGSFVEREGQELFNTSLVLDSRGEIIAKYRKIHLFGYQSDEKQLLTPGERIEVFDLPWGRAGITTCYDLRFPELYRLMMNQGAVFFLVPSAWPLARLEAWKLFNRARAHENLAFLISCNCAGSSRGVAFAGHSMIVDPQGQIVAEGGQDGCLVTADIEPAEVQAIRKNFSVLDDRVYRLIARN